MLHQNIVPHTIFVPILAALTSISILKTTDNSIYDEAEKDKYREKWEDSETEL